MRRVIGHELPDNKPSIFCLCSLNVFTEICPYFDLYSWSVGSMHFCHVFVEDKHGCFDVQHCYATLPAIKAVCCYGEKTQSEDVILARAQCVLFSFSVCPPSNKSSSVKSCIMNAPCFHLEGSACSLDILLSPPSTSDHLCCQSSLGTGSSASLCASSPFLPPSVACRLCIPSSARRRQSDQIKSSFAALHSPSVHPFSPSPIFPFHPTRTRLPSPLARSPMTR